MSSITAKPDTGANADTGLAEEISNISQKGFRLVSEQLPKIADAARQAGRSVKESVADLASSAGDALEALPGDEALKAHALKATGLAVASAAALQAAQQGLVRLATRRPLLFVLGGFAIVAGIVIASRRKAGADEEIGEGSYAGARDYHERTQAFLKSEGDGGARQARRARKAVEGSEGAALAAAEAEGRRHARS